MAAEKKRIQALEAAQKEKERQHQLVSDAKKKRDQEEKEKSRKIAEEAQRVLLQKKNDMDFEVQTGRVKVAKEVRKVR